LKSLQEQVFWEIHTDNPREGPGSFKSTRRAFSALLNLPAIPTILDIGCGPGKQTIDLAAISKGHIYAIDLHKPFLDKLQEKVNKLNLSDRVYVKQHDMTSSLPFEQEYFDIIWAEGSIYIIGFDKGLINWHPYLKSGGYIAVTEVSWLKQNPPAEVVRFWHQNYPAMQTIEGNLSIIQQSGYKLVDYFTLPENDWWEDYYCFIEQKIIKLEKQYQNTEEALKIIDVEKQEINLFKKYHSYYGYVFYIAQKN
jgi:ubiquinone/menaquinone biosynthesis C-methylase UbiE